MTPTAAPGPDGTLAVEVPATAANLGPGFDAFAVALDPTIDVSTVARGGRRVITEGEGAGELPDDDGNLVWRALRAYCDWAGVALPDVSLRSRSQIPLERGMGSSAAAAVAGVSLGRALAGGTAGGPPGAGSDHDLVGIVAELEGHRDNAAAAMLGGLVVCARGRSVRFEPSARLRPVLCVPSTRQSTAAARRLLPSSVPLADAASNGARAALTLAGLAGWAAFDPHMMVDALHEPPRLETMAGSGRLVAALRGEGLGACLSGAGPSVLAVVPVDDAEAVATIRRHAGGGWRVRPSAWHRGGATVRPTHVTPTR